MASLKWTLRSGEIDTEAARFAIDTALRWNQHHHNQHHHSISISISISILPEGWRWEKNPRINTISSPATPPKSRLNALSFTWTEPHQFDQLLCNKTRKVIKQRLYSYDNLGNSQLTLWAGKWPNSHIGWVKGELRGCWALDNGQQKWAFVWWVYS